MLIMEPYLSPTNTLIQKDTAVKIKQNIQFWKIIKNDNKYQ